MTIPFSEVPNDYRPERYLELQFNGAPGGSAAGWHDIYIMAERLTTGTSSANEVRTTPFADADEAGTWFGAGSFGEFMARQVFRGGKLRSRVYGVAVAEGSTAASVAYIFATNAGTAGTFVINVAGALVSFTVEANDTPTIAGDAFVAKFNALDPDVKPPCTLVNVAGTVTATMNNKGAQGNTAPAYQIINGQEPTAMTLSIATKVFASGTGYPTITTALANMANVRTPIIVHGWEETPDGSTKNMDLIRDHLITKCGASKKFQGRMVTCVTKVLATCITDASTLDDDDAERCAIAAIPVNTTTNSPGSWSVAAACYVANAIGQQIDPAYPYNNVALPYMVQPPDSGDVLTDTEVSVLIEGGVTPLNWSDDRQRYVLVKGVGCRLFNTKPQSWGIVDGSDWFRYQVDVALAAAFPSGWKLAEAGETNLDAMTTTPAGVLDIVRGVFFGPLMKGVLRNRETLWPAAFAETNPLNENRVDFQEDHAIMNGLDIIAGKLRQRGGLIGNP
jgi:phage tail sheath gpL-like